MPHPSHARATHVGRAPRPARRCLASQTSCTAMGAATLALLAAGAFPLAAQGPATRGPLTGLVRDSATGRPIAGAAVLLRDAAGATVARGLSDEDGRFRLAPPAPAAAGPRSIRVLRLGFRPADVALAEGAGPTGAVQVALAPVPPLLAPVRVAAAGGCPRRDDAAAALALLDQVRAALLATIIARTERPGTVTFVSYERQWAPNLVPPYPPGDDGDPGELGRQLTLQTARVRTGASPASPFVTSRTPEGFVRDGFRIDGPAGTSYAAPDAETLVDDAFAAAYCFRVVPQGAGRPHEVGLGFAPGRRRDGRVDVEGVLRVDTVANELRDLTFRYVGVDRALEALRPGGAVHFARMPGGAPYLQRWALRLAGTDPGGPPGAARALVAEVGGELARVAWTDGRAWQGSLGAVRVRVTDPAGRPVPGATVRLELSDWLATADSAGVVELPDVLPGTWHFTVDDARLDAFGLRRGGTGRVVARRGAVTESAVTVESAERAVAARCARDPGSRPTDGAVADGALLVGRVVDGSGAPVADARWRLLDARGAPLVPGGRTGRDGVFQACGLAPDETILLEAWRDGAGGRPVETARLPLRPQALTTVVATLRPAGSDGPIAMDALVRPPAGLPPARDAGDGRAVAVQSAGGPPRTLEQLLAGRFPGVEVAAVPGGGVRVRIRNVGGADGGRRDPLFVVDGTPLAESAGGVLQIDPAEVERIEVLRTVAEVAPYGVRGGGGVVLVTTRRGGRRADESVRPAARGPDATAGRHP